MTTKAISLEPKEQPAPPQDNTPNAQLLHSIDAPIYNVLGVQLQFLVTPQAIGDDISIIRGTLFPGAVIPLHSHPDPEIFYIADGRLEVFQGEQWRTASTGDLISLPGNVKHALRNTFPAPVVMIGTTKTDLYKFFRELATPGVPDGRTKPPTPAAMEELFAAAAKYHYWLASPAENDAIGLSVV